MKVNDVVTTHDGSWTLLLTRSGLQKTNGLDIQNRKWRVIAVGCKLPSDDRLHEKPNDTILQEIDHEENVLYIREELCRPTKETY